MKRGEIRQYLPAITRPGQSLLRLIVSTDAINDNDAHPTVLTVHLATERPESLLSVQVGEHGWARVLTVEPAQRSRMGDLVDTADDTDMQAVSMALRVALDL